MPRHLYTRPRGVLAIGEVTYDLAVGPVVPR